MQVLDLVAVLKARGIPVILDVEKPNEVTWADWIFRKGFEKGTKVECYQNVTHRPTKTCF